MHFLCLGVGAHPILWRHTITSGHYPKSQVLEGGRWRTFQVGVVPVFSIQVCRVVARYQDVIFLLSNSLFVKHGMQIIYKLRWSRITCARIKVSSRTSLLRCPGDSPFQLPMVPQIQPLLCALFSTYFYLFPRANCFILFLLLTFLNTTHCGYIHDH